MSKLAIALSWFLVMAGAVLADLPPVAVPLENPITEPKRLLGKILFWDEQLSSDDTVSCGTCHDPGHAGADEHQGLHPGLDETFGTLDDVIGSPGVALIDASGNYVEDPVFGFEPQVTGRSANPAVDAMFAPELFWDGRASGVFIDPLDDRVSIASGGALESQALAPLLSDVEMAREGRDWADVMGKIQRSAPLADATGLPPDLATALATAPTYAELFQSAFGSPEVTPERIAFAMATYERTQVPDQTPWDLFVAGDSTAMTPLQQQGWTSFQLSECSLCHVPPLFTDNSFRNVGMRPWEEDAGRMEVTGLFEDRGKFKVPTLRNVGLKPTYMHNGKFTALEDVVVRYTSIFFPDNVDPILPAGVSNQEAFIDFVANALTDPRVAAEEFPFDHPVLHAGDLPVLDFSSASQLEWPVLHGVQSYNVYRGDLASLSNGNGDGLPDAGYGSCVSQGDLNPSDGAFTDTELPASGAGFFYVKTVIDNLGAERGAGATSAGQARPIQLPCP